METPGFGRGRKRRLSFLCGVSSGSYVFGVSRYRLCPTAAQVAGLAEHCRHARFVWNLAVEQQQYW
ncbi:MAG TPA: helix-turn-helix domain-containing protein, partial [Mycobacterium sp.]|nr:helix-turn-helix domain-containing protein [Mycobacterium sp.]